MNKTKRSVTLIMSLALLIVAVIGATFAFFSATAQIAEQSISLEAATPTGLVYSNNGLMTLDNAIPGDRSQVQTFTVQNPSTSSLKQVYTLSLSIDQNGFTAANDDGQVILYLGHGNCTVDETEYEEPLTCDTITTIDLTDGLSEMAANTLVAVYQALVVPNETQTYYTYLQFVDTGSNQDENKNASFAAHIALTESILVKDEALPYNELTTNNKIKTVYQAITSESQRTLKSLHLTAKADTPNFNVSAPIALSYADGDYGEEITITPKSWYDYGEYYEFDDTMGVYFLQNNSTVDYETSYSTLIGKYIQLEDFNMMPEYYTIYYVTDATPTTITYREKSVVVTYDLSNSGIYSAQDNYGTSYYFRGAPENNYVKFGKNSNNEDMYWRIIRINGDGSLRMIYDGTQAWPNRTSSQNRYIQQNVSWKTTNNWDSKFAGYMYGGVGEDTTSTYYQADMTAPDYANSNNAVYNETSSRIKSIVDTWYENNILNTGYASYLSDEIFCNDRSLRSGDLGYGKNSSKYGPYLRYSNENDNNPTLMCAQRNDSFTVGTYTNVGQDDPTGYGNGYLKYPIGLITGDETVMAGGRMWDYDNTSNYLFKGESSYWTMSPEESPYSCIFTNGIGLNHECALNSSGVVPVINLSQSTARGLIGNGTRSNPYRLS